MRNIDSSRYMLSVKYIAKISLAFCLMVMISFVFSIPTLSATSYEGKGTKSNPYIIKTPEQLDGIRNNLSAHYKLGATIDMSSFGNFVAIGHSAKPFTGSLKCDVDKEGKPIYAILNLKVEFKGEGACLAEGWTGYKDDGSMGWQVGLFGKAKGATFENIILLNANISSNVEGRTSMNSDYSVNPTDHQGTGGLVADGESVKITGCGITGTVTSSSNYTGGLIGTLNGSSKVSNSYSYATVNATGMWGSGGFCAGISSSSKIDSCAYNGNFNNTSSYSTHGGAFIGGLDKSAEGKTKLVTNSWCAGTVSSDKFGCFGGVNNHTSDTQASSVEVCEYTYTLSTIVGRTKAQTNTRVKNNNYITNQIGGLESGYAAADAATVSAAFKDNDKWVIVDGQYPQLKNLVIITEVSELGKPEENAVTTPATESDTNSAAETVTDNSTSVNDTATENNKESNEIKPEVKNKTIVTELSKNDKIIVFTMLGLVGIVFIGAIFTVVFVLIKSKKRVEKC